MSELAIILLIDFLSLNLDLERMTNIFTSVEFNFILNNVQGLHHSKLKSFETYVNVYQKLPTLPVNWGDIAWVM